MGWSDFWSGVGENLSNIFGGSAAARRNAEKQMGDYRNAINNYTGSEGYKNALNQATKETARLAGQQANQAASQQQSALRSSGQSGNAAAVLAGNNAFNAYQNAYNNNIQGQQSAAYNAGLDNVNSQRAYNQDRISTAEAGQKQSGQGMQQIADVAGRVASFFSDEKTKNAVSTDEFFEKYKPRKMESLKVNLSKGE
ncbi:MAG: hypothetical protein MJZ11_12820 [Lachnospiraceae bacterium]|nr:hypothetical protein [Lachnospiraceae bacterium]